MMKTEALKLLANECTKPPLKSGKNVDVIVRSTERDVKRGILIALLIIIVLLVLRLTTR